MCVFLTQIVAVHIARAAPNERFTNSVTINFGLIKNESYKYNSPKHHMLVNTLNQFLME